MKKSLDPDSGECLLDPLMYAKVAQLGRHDTLILSLSIVHAIFVEFVMTAHLL